MSPLRKIGKVYYSDIRIAGKRVRVPLSTDKVVATEKLREMEAERNQAKYGAPINQISWPLFRKKYLAYCAGNKAPATAERDRMAILALEKHLRISRLADISVEVLEDWKGTRKQAGKGAATINRDIRAIKTMMRKAVDWGYLSSFKSGSIKEIRQARGRLLFYTRDECKRLLTVCKSRYSAFYDWETICLLGLRAGLRRAEIYWLAWEDVDLKRGVLSVTPKEGWQPKSGEQRHIPIPKDLRTHIVRTSKRTSWVIGERPPLRTMTFSFRQISRKAGLSGNIHTLRHTYASHLAQAGIDLYTISKLLGHSDPKMSTIYAHLSPKTYSDAVSRLPAL